MKSDHQTPRILIAYSNPANTSRLRLDKENKYLDKVLSDHRLHEGAVRRLHAASTDDLARAIREFDFEIIQFSGHGSTQGFYLESEDSGSGAMLTAEQMAMILGDGTPNRQAVIFLSCYSAAAIVPILKAAPYIVTVSGPLDDSDAIRFICAFYDTYFRNAEIEKAFTAAVAVAESQSKVSTGLNAILSRKGDSIPNRLRIKAFPGGDSILIDITDAQMDLLDLQISLDTLLSLLGRKLRVHSRVFKLPRERAILSFAHLVGWFSWQNAKDVVTCHRIAKVRVGVKEKECDAWASLLVAYNDFWTSPYRFSKQRIQPGDRKALKRAVNGFYDLFRAYFLDEGWASASLRALAPNHFKTTRALVGAYLRKADEKYQLDDFEETVNYLECALSTLHDFVDELTKIVTQGA